MHRLVFEKDGLPDGTEVAYYARGQVVKIEDTACLIVSYFLIGINCSFLWTEIA